MTVLSSKAITSNIWKCFGYVSTDLHKTAMRVLAASPYLAPGSVGAISGTPDHRSWRPAYGCVRFVQHDFLQMFYIENHCRVRSRLSQRKRRTATRTTSRVIYSLYIRFCCTTQSKPCSQQTKWTELNWLASSWPSSTTRYWSRAPASRS